MPTFKDYLQAFHNDLATLNSNVAKLCEKQINNNTDIKIMKDGYLTLSNGLDSKVDEQEAVEISRREIEFHTWYTSLPDWEKNVFNYIKETTRKNQEDSKKLMEGIFERIWPNDYNPLRNSKQR